LVDDCETALSSVPLSRGFSAARAALRAIPALALAVVVVWVFRGLEFVPSGTSNRLVDYCIAVVLLPVSLIAMFCAVAAVRLTLLACWPGPSGVFAYADAMVLRFGPFGTKRYDAERLDVRYPFEMSADSSDDNFEALLPEEIQLEQMCPRMAHPDSPEPLDRLIRRFTGCAEMELATLLRPAIEHYRRERTG
jgi:hypothetical protein